MLISVHMWKETLKIENENYVITVFNLGVFSPYVAWILDIIAMNSPDFGYLFSLLKFFLTVWLTYLAFYVVEHTDHKDHLLSCQEEIKPLTAYENTCWEGSVSIGAEVLEKYRIRTVTTHHNWKPSLKRR